jgi:hypothetical protein
MGVVRRRGLLTSPVFAASIGLLVVNDHVLKATWPGAVTGKLSDAAGVAMIAIVIAALCRRADVALVTTALAFTLLKTVPVVARWAAPVLGGVTRTDPWDLLALVVLVPVWWWLRHAPTSPRTGPRPAAFALQALLVGAAVFATTATSCDTKGVGAIHFYDGALLATTDGTEYRSDDGGATWQRWPADVSIDYDKVNDDQGVCIENGCVIADSVKGTLTETRGTSTTTILSLDDAERRQIAELGNPDCGSGTFGSVATIEVNGEPNVVVSMGPAGALHRSPDGTWQWVAIGRWAPKPDADGTYLGIPVADAG